MFFMLLLVTLVLALTTAVVVARLFARPINSILRRIIADEIGAAWSKYLQFAIIVVGVSAGVRIHALERYISPPEWQQDAQILPLTTERWTLEIYRTIIETLQGIAWMLLVFFVFALIAYVIVRMAELKREKASPTTEA